MKILKFIGAHLRLSCVYFACTEISVSILFQLMAKSDAQANFMPLSVMLYIMLFSISLAFAQDIFKIKASLTARILLHALAYLVSVFFLFLFITQGLDNVSMLVFVILGAFILYFIVGGLILLVYSLYKKRLVNKTQYTNQFSGKKNG